MARKKEASGLLEELKLLKPKFEPELVFGPDVKRYEGKLTLLPNVKFHVTANRQYGENSNYAVRGTVALLNPKDGYLFQPPDDILKGLKETRREKGLAEITSDHSFETAVKRELLVKKRIPTNSDEEIDFFCIDYTDDVVNEALLKANLLLIAHEKELCYRLSHDVNISKMPLNLLLTLFGTAYFDTRTSSEDQKAEYRRRIEIVAATIGLVPVGELNVKNLLKLTTKHPNITAERLREVHLFLDYAAMHRGSENPLSTVIPDVINRLPRKRDIPGLRDDATLPPVLTEAVEAKINAELLGKFDFLSAGLVLIKEGRLTPEDVCTATFGMLDYSGENPDWMFFLLRRDKYAGATHDYRFPLLPFGVYYMREYIKRLVEKFGESRIDAKKYILSDSNDGSIPIDANALKEYCHKEIEMHPFGYAALANIKPSRTPKVITLLHNTFDKRLEEACRLRNDRGTLMFMRHQSLAHSVQADCYRGFTDRTGMDYLYRSTRRDQRGIPPLPKEKRVRSTRIEKETHRKITRCPADSNGFATTTIISLEGLRAGDIVTINVRNGCFVSVLPPE